jgi:hypothetical protein
MKGEALRFAVCAAVFGNSACTTDVTLRLFEHDTAISGGPQDAASDGDGGTGSCRKLGEEVCNGADDDCNGVVDEGCDYSVVWTSQPDGAALGHTAGGVAFLSPCPDGSVLTGMRLGFGESLNQVSTACSQIGLGVATTNGVVTFSLTLGPRFTKGFAPSVTQDPTNQLYDMFCPDGLIASTLEGVDDPTRHILAVRMRCAPPVVSTQMVGAVLDVDLTQEQALAPVSCVTCPATPNYTFTSSVPGGQIAKRLFGGVGASVNRVGFGTSIATVAKL